jgi:DDE family transposase
VRCYNPDEIAVAFDDERLVADAGLMLPATLTVGLGLRELLDTHVDLGEASGRANVGDKAMTLIHSALAGGSWIDDCDRLRAGATGQVLGHRVAAPSTIGTFLRSFSWGHARQLDAVSGQALQRAYKAGAGPGAAPLTIDVDSTICEVYGTGKQGAEFGHTGVRGDHPLLAFAAGTWDLLHGRLRGGSAYTARGRPGLSPRRSAGCVRPGPAGR